MHSRVNDGIDERGQQVRVKRPPDTPELSLLFHVLGLVITPPPIGEQSIVMNVSVCVCLSVRDHIFGTTRPIFTKFFVHVTYGRGSALPWRRSDVLCISGSMDDVSYLLKSQGCSTSPPS